MTTGREYAKAHKSKAELRADREAKRAAEGGSYIERKRPAQVPADQLTLPLDISKNSWSDIRTVIVQRAYDIAIKERTTYVGMRTMDWYLKTAADQVLTTSNALENLEATRWNRLSQDLRILISEGRIPNTVRGVSTVSPKEQEQGIRRAQIVVTTTSGQVLAVKPPGMDEINMNDSATLQEEAAAAGIEIRPMENEVDPRLLDRNGRPLSGIALKARQAAIERENDPNAAPVKKATGTCIYSGNPTSGGRFQTGYDAKFKSVLLRRFRDENAVIDDPLMSDALRERFATGDLSTAQGAYNEAINQGWEKYMVMPTPKSPKTTTKIDLGTGNFSIFNLANNELLQRVANDEAAETWCEANGYEVSESTSTAVFVLPATDDDED